MKYMIQLINHENGERTQPVAVSLEEFKRVLRDAELNEDQMKDYVLLVGSIDDDNNMNVIGTPIFTVKSLLELDQEEVVNG